MATKPLNQEKLQAQLKKARTRAACFDATHPHATDASYNADTQKVTIELSNGVVFQFPVEMGQGLSNASMEDLSQVEITPSGLGLHWESLDADLSIPELLSGIYGTAQWMVDLGRKGGQSISAAKTAAAQENGKKGGRPKKQSALV